MDIINDTGFFDATVQVRDPNSKRTTYDAVLHRRNKKAGLPSSETYERRINESPFLQQLIETREKNDLAFISMYAEAKIRVEKGLDPTGKYASFVSHTTPLLSQSPTKADFFLLEEKENELRAATFEKEEIQDRPFTQREFDVARAYSLLIYSVETDACIVRQKRNDPLTFLGPAQIGKADACDLMDYLQSHKKEFFDHPRGLFPVVRLCQKAINEYSEKNVTPGEAIDMKKLKEFINAYAHQKASGGEPQSKAASAFGEPTAEWSPLMPEEVKSGITP